MLKPLFLAAAAAALAAPAAMAEVPFRYISAADAAKMITDPATAKEADNLASSDGFRVAFKMRNKPGSVENHATQDDEMVIQEGDVLVNYGGTTVNARPTKAPGETIGDSITGGKSVLMHAGDIIVVPAGTPHQMLIQTPTMRYLLFKTKAVPGASFKYISAADAAKMPFNPATAKDAAHVAGGEAFTMSLSKRIESGHVERHAAWNETLLIQEGDVTLHYGDTATGSTASGPGEMRGGTITNAKTAHLHPGDLVILPADTWHEQILNSPRMRYVLFKSKK